MVRMAAPPRTEPQRPLKCLELSLGMPPLCECDGVSLSSPVLDFHCHESTCAHHADRFHANESNELHTRVDDPLSERTVEETSRYSPGIRRSCSTRAVYLEGIEYI
mmetsp:Transcript_35709/g.93768  ORF Transcript_35709/g.93768 Transcript_35709/m.93768 type:complete len:106 (-) Transcript_35709:515-832(-)